MGFVGLRFGILFSLCLLLSSCADFTSILNNRFTGAVPFSLSVNEDEAYTGQLQMQGERAGGTFILGRLPVLGTVTLTSPSQGVFVYTPGINQNGIDTFTFAWVSDDGETSDFVEVTINVRAQNDAPVANAILSGVLSTPKNVTLNGTLTGTDPDGSPVTFSRTAQAGHGTVTVNANGSFVYVPANNYLGPDTFAFRVYDGVSHSAPATVAITVYQGNRAPTANGVAIGTLTTPNNASLTGTLTGSDLDGNPLTFARVTQAGHGSVTVSSNGSFTYTPTNTYVGADSFTFKVNDGTVYSLPATVNITVTQANRAPTAGTVVTGILSTPKNTVLNGSLVSYASDIDGNPITFARVAQAGHGTATVNANGSFTYTPANNYVGADSFSYKVNDGSVDSPAATVNITVTQPNRTPVANPIALGVLSTPKNTALNGTLTGSDADGNPLTFARVTQAGHGSVTVNASGSFTYTPANNYVGPDSFSFKVNDGTVDSNASTVAITVTQPNRAPTTSNVLSGVFSTPKNAPLSGSLTGHASDPDGNALTYIRMAQASNGSVSINANGSFTYTPANNYVGADSFSFKVNDGAYDSNTSTVAVTVTQTNRAPVVFVDPDDDFSTNKNTVLSDTVADYATDADGNALTFIRTTQAQHGTVNLNTNGSFTYIPDTDYVGADAFEFKANDGTFDSNIGRIELKVLEPRALSAVFDCFPQPSGPLRGYPSCLNEENALMAGENILLRPHDSLGHRYASKGDTLSTASVIKVGFRVEGGNARQVIQFLKGNGAADASGSNVEADSTITKDFGESDDFAMAAAFDANGKAVVAGYSWANSTAILRVSRYDGRQADTTFNSDGTLSLQISSLSQLIPMDIAIATSGRIYVAGMAYDGIQYRFFIVAISSNGSLDSSFGSDGFVAQKVDGFGHIYGNALAIEADGNVLLAGKIESLEPGNVTVEVGGQVLTTYQPFVFRLNPEGDVIDAISPTVEASHAVREIHLVGDKIIVAGTMNYFAVIGNRTQVWAMTLEHDLSLRSNNPYTLVTIEADNRLLSMHVTPDYTYRFLLSVRSSSYRYVFYLDVNTSNEIVTHDVPVSSPAQDASYFVILEETWLKDPTTGGGVKIGSSYVTYLDEVMNTHRTTVELKDNAAIVTPHLKAACNPSGLRWGIFTEGGILRFDSRIPGTNNLILPVCP